MFTTADSKNILNVAKDELSVSLLPSGLALDLPPDGVALTNGLTTIIDVVKSAFEDNNVDAPDTSLMDDIVPDALKQVKLNEFKLEAEETDGEIVETRLYVGVMLQGENGRLWNLFDGILAIESVSAVFVWTFSNQPDTPTQFSAGFLGDLALGDVSDLSIQINYPDQVAILHATGQWTLESMLTRFNVNGFDGLPFDGATDNSALKVEEIFISGDLLTGRFELLIALETDPSLQLSTGNNQSFALSDLTLGVLYEGGKFSFQVEAAIQVGTTLLGIMLSKQGEQWQVYGQVDASADAITVNDVFNEFADLLGTGTTDLGVLGSSGVHYFDISFIYARDGLENIQLVCEMTIGMLPFVGAFTIENDLWRFIATYQPDTLDPQRIDRLCAALFADMGGADLFPATEITIVSAFLFGQKTVAGSSLVFGLDMGSHVDFSDLKLVGEYLSDVSMTYQIFVASGDVNDDLMDAIEDNLQLVASSFSVVERGSSDEPILTTGFNLKGKINLGQFPILLTAPMPAAGESEADANTPNNSDDPPAIVENISWIPIQRSLGPLYFAQIGFSWDTEGVSKRLKVSLDATLDIDVLYFELDGLSIASPIDRFEPQFGLRGFGLGSRSKDIEVYGQFSIIESADDSPPEFEGSAEITAATFSITAMGAFKEIMPGEYSLFLYAALLKEIGGPAFFFVTGVSLGFGYNRDIVLPTSPSQVADYVLVKPLEGNTDEAPDDNTSVTKYFPAKGGSHWIAAGVKFESFKMVESKVVLVASFGQTLDISLMGLSTLKLPRKGSATKEPFALVELAIQARVKPELGELKVQGIITDRSYVISPDATLGGGFAFYTWFGNHQYSGDFVLTVGGYHPHFERPEHYPVVPRISINWHLSDEITIKGEAYLALTPSHIMAGGKLRATYETGRLKAAFTAYADFLMQWEPFSYDISIGIHVSVSYDTGLFGEATASLGAQLHLWGPEMNGLAVVEWLVFSFEIPIGDSDYDKWKRSLNDQNMSITEFVENFLPKPNQRAKLTITGGIERKIGTNEDPIFVINASELTVSTQSVVPITKLTVSGNTEPANPDVDLLRVRPVGGGTYRSEHTLRVTSTSGEIIWETTKSKKEQVPPALWDVGIPDREGDGLTPEPQLAITGIKQLRVSRLDKTIGSTNAYPIKLFEHTEVIGELGDIPLTHDRQPPIPHEAAENVVIQDEFETVANTASTRKDIRDALEELGFTTLDKELDLEELKTRGMDVFRNAPMVGKLGSTGNVPETEIKIHVIPQKIDPATEPQTEILILLKAIVRQYLEERDGDVQHAFDIAEGTQEKHRRTIQTVETSSTTDEGTGQAPQVDPSEIITIGKTMFWDIQTGKDAHEPQLAMKITQGNVDLPMEMRIVQLDRYHRVLSNEIKTLDTQVLNPETAHLSISGIPKKTLIEWEFPGVGWHAQSQLLVVRPRMLVVDDVIIQPEVSQRISFGALQLPVGMMTPEMLNRNNRLRGSDQQIVPGWVKTQIPTQIKHLDDKPVRTIAVVLRRLNLTRLQAPDLTVNIPDISDVVAPSLMHLPEPSLNPTTITFFYDLPRTAAEGDSVTVKVQLNNSDWALDGVAAYAEPDYVLRQNWDAFRPRPVRQSQESLPEITSHEDLPRIELVLAKEIN